MSIDILRLLRETKIELKERFFWHRLSMETKGATGKLLGERARKELTKIGYPRGVSSAIDYVKDYRKGRVKAVESSVEIPYHKDTKKFSGDGSEEIESVTTKRFRTVEDMIAYHKIDLKKFTVELKEATYWEQGAKLADGTIIVTPLHRMKVLVSPIKTAHSLHEEIRKWLESEPSFKPVRFRTAKETEGVLMISDLHFGAAVKAFLLTKTFDESVLLSYIEAVAEKVNEARYKKLHVMILGDLIESWTGLNHDNTWQELGKYGVDAAKGVYLLLKDFLLAKIKNLGTVYIISGNHDRTSIKQNLDMKGGAAELVAFMLEQAGVNVKFDPFLISEEIDGIHYVLTHGNWGLGKRDPSQVILKHGNQQRFNVLASGHLHTSQKKGRLEKRLEIIDDVKFVTAENSSFISVTVPSLFTGNTYSQTLGFNSSAAFLVIENSGKGRPNILNYAL